MKIKICGITDLQALQTCIACGIDFAGFVFAEKSLRFLSLETAATLSQIANNRIDRVGLFVNPSDEQLQQTIDTVGLDMIQLHGSETPERVSEVAERFGLPVIKALPVATKSDLKITKSYQNITRYILFDTKSDSGFGGSGQAFDWSFLTDFKAPVPWMLAGGLHNGNIRQALSILKPDVIDISSGVEERPGIKSPARIKEFIETVRNSV